MKLLEDGYFYLYSLPIPVETSLKLRVRDKLGTDLDNEQTILAIYDPSARGFGTKVPRWIEQICIFL